MRLLRLLPALALVAAILIAGCARTAPFTKQSKQSNRSHFPSQGPTFAPEASGKTAASSSSMDLAPYLRPGSHSSKEASDGPNSSGSLSSDEAVSADEILNPDEVRQQTSTTRSAMAESQGRSASISNASSSASSSGGKSLATTNVVPAAFTNSSGPTGPPRVAQASAEAPAVAPPPPVLADTPDTGPSRPVPLMEGLLAGGQPASSVPEDSPGAAEWDSQLQKMIDLAASRAEAARTSFLAAKAGGTSNSSKPPERELASLRRDYVSRQVDLRLLYLMAGQQGRALQPIPDVKPGIQEFWRGLLWSVASYFNTDSMPDRPLRMTQTLERLRTAVAKLQGEARLQLRNVALCRRITSFGNFERFDGESYAPGQKVLLYAEIVNFESIRRKSDGLFKTVLKSTIEIYPEGGEDPVHRIEFEPTVDLCRSYRQDYFHSYELRVPADLKPGPYVLKLSIEDVASGEVAVYSLNFTVE